jgi:hypothetical protein
MKIIDHDGRVEISCNKYGSVIEGDFQIAMAKYLTRIVPLKRRPRKSQFEERLKILSNYIVIYTETHIKFPYDFNAELLRYSTHSKARVEIAKRIISGVNINC